MPTRDFPCQKIDKGDVNKMKNKAYYMKASWIGTKKNIFKAVKQNNQRPVKRISAGSVSARHYRCRENILQKSSFCDKFIAQNLDFVVPDKRDNKRA